MYIFQAIIKNGIPLVLIAVGGWKVLTGMKEMLEQLHSTKRKQKMLDYWRNRAPKSGKNDTVILHQFPRSKRMPNPSGFALKLEKFLRMAKIPYEIDTTCPKGERQKVPWITLNGENFTDSQLIIEELEKKFGAVLGNYSPEERAIATLARLMIEEHFYWGLILWRYVYSKGSQLRSIFSRLSAKELEAFREMCNLKYKTFTWYQGLGRYSQEEVLTLMEKDLRALSLIIGEKQFLLGVEPCADDSAIFGIVSHALWADLGSPFEKLITGELTNLHDYCIHMKEKFWPDWDDCLDN